MSKVWKFGDDVNTDEIIPGRYNITTDPNELARHCLIEIKPEFSKNVKEGDFIVAGENFGCGSSREHAPIAIKASGIKAVIAKSFARIFYRNAINIGLPVLICKEIDDVSEQDKIEIDLSKGEIKNLANNKIYNSTKLPKFILEIIKSDGIINYLKNHTTIELENEA